MSLIELKGAVFRVRALTNAWLVEVPFEEDHIAALARFCAEKELIGHHITSVTRIYDCSKDTPRIGVLSTPEYKEALCQVRKEMAYREQPQSYPKSVEELISRAEYKGWSVSMSCEESIGTIYLEFSQASPAGEDFYFDANGKDAEELTDDVIQYALDFDQEEHIKLMLEMQGNPGATALVEDAAEIQEMLNDLAEAVMLPVPESDNKGGK